MGSMTGFVLLLQKTADVEDEDFESDEDADHVVFQYRIEVSEKVKIRGREPGQPVVTLTQLKKDKTVKS